MGEEGEEGEVLQWGWQYLVTEGDKKGGEVGSSEYYTTMCVHCVCVVCVCCVCIVCVCVCVCGCVCVCVCVCTSSMELELPWDPVYESYKEMMCAKTRLIAACPFGMAMARDTPLLSPGEVFVLDGSIQLLG